ncbi:hypothetical protein ACFX1T_012741 [Malus domestica]
MELLLVEIQAFAFSKAGLLRDHDGRSQKSKRRLLSQKLGCSKTTKADLRNRRSACFLKSWAAQRPRRPISEIKEAFAFSKVGLLKDHEGRYQKSKKRLLLKSWAAQRPRGPISEIEEAPTFLALSAPVTCTLSFTEITGILLKISGETSKHAQPLLTFEKTLPTRLLAPKSKRHCPPNLESQTPNMIIFSKIEETPLFESQEPDSQQDCFLKNRRGIVLRISRARSPTGLPVRKPKRHRFLNFESQISLDKSYL